MATEWLYVASFFGALSLSLALVPLVRAIAIRQTILDLPGAHKSHHSPVPYLGGVAMVVAFSLAVAIGGFVMQGSSASDVFVLIRTWNNPSPQMLPLRELIFVLSMALSMSLVGLLDDLRGLKPLSRLAVESLIAVLVVSFGIQFESSLPDILNWAITVAWIVGISNAMNLLDNMDGLAAGVSAVAASSFFIVAILRGQPLVALLAVGLAGCTLGFLRSNFNPAKIYMGDAGSLYLGFMLAYLGLQIRAEQSQYSQMLVPVVILGVAILDTTLVVGSRIARGISPFTAGKDHLSHRLFRFELGVRKAVAVILLYAAFLGIQGIALAYSTGILSALLVASVVVSMVMITALVTKKSMVNRVPLATVVEMQKRAQ